MWSRNIMKKIFIGNSFEVKDMKRRNVLILMLALALSFAVTCSSVFADENEPAISIGIGALEKNDIIWFGGRSATEPFHTGWKILKIYDGSALLLSDRVMEDYQPFNYYSASNIYSDSIVRQKCIALYDNWPANLYIERNAILLTNIEETEGTDDQLPCSVYEEHFYLLSVPEIENTDLFADISERDALKVDGSESERWWTRSPSIRERKFTAWVQDSDYQWKIGNYQIDNNAGIRPAFKINLTNVLFVSHAVSGKDGGPALSPVPQNAEGEYKITFLDNSREFKVSDTAFKGVKGKALDITYKDAADGDNEYVSMIVLQDNVALYYASSPISEPEGTVSFDIPEDITEGAYSAYVFNEHKNPDKISDWSSAFVSADLEIKAPQSFVVEFESNGGSPVATQTIKEGDKVQKPNDPEREGFTFVGWYNAGDPGDPYDFEKPVEASFTLYAVWKQAKPSPDTGDHSVWTPVMAVSLMLYMAYAFVYSKKKER